LGNLEEGLFTGDLERRMKGALGMGLLRIWASLSIGAPVVPRGTWCLGGEACILGTLKDG